MENKKKPTPQERKEITAQLRAKHQPTFDTLNIPDAIFIPKMAHHVKGLDGIHMGFFESELNHGEDIYTEKVSMILESEDPDRVLYKLRYNPHYREEYEASDPMPNGHCRYYVPVDEMEVIQIADTAIKTITIPNDPDMDAPMDQMTLRDYAAIHMNKPISLKQWLNDIITNKLSK